jgi:hypothetical protein
MKDAPTPAIIPVERAERSILLLRGQRIILATDLAELYGVPVKQLNQAVTRNRSRFPADFVFQLTWEEARHLRFQSGTLTGRHFRYRPYAFTEHGAVMAANVLRSPLAVKASVYVVRAFVQLREMLATHHQLAAKLSELESKLQDHDGQIIAIVDAIRQLMAEPRPRRKPAIGYHTEGRVRKDAKGSIESKRRHTARQRSKYKVAGMASKITGPNPHGEMFSDGPVGREVL